MYYIPQCLLEKLIVPMLNSSLLRLYALYIVNNLRLYILITFLPFLSPSKLFQYILSVLFLKPVWSDLFLISSKFRLVYFLSYQKQPCCLVVCLKWLLLFFHPKSVLVLGSFLAGDKYMDVLNNLVSWCMSFNWIIQTISIHNYYFDFVVFSTLTVSNSFLVLHGVFFSWDLIDVFIYLSFLSIC